MSGYDGQRHVSFLPPLPWVEDCSVIHSSTLDSQLYLELYWVSDSEKTLPLTCYALTIHPKSESGSQDLAYTLRTFKVLMVSYFSGVRLLLHFGDSIHLDFLYYSWLPVKCYSASLCPTLCNPMDCSLTRLLCPWSSPGKNTEVGCHSLLQGIFLM